MARGILLLGVLCCTAGIAIAQPISDTHEKLLGNGLKIIVREDHRAPVVVSQIWYKVGGSYENDNCYGVSHALEHMMFKGTTNYPSGYFSTIIAEHGGQQNAFTSYDYTTYYQKLDAAQLELSLALEADRMKNLLLSEEQFSKEIQVVEEERRLRIEDDPNARTRELFFATSYINNPRQHPLLGWMSDIQNLTIGDLREWYKTWYVPNNAILVVVGDVDPQRVFDLAEKYFGSIQAGDIPSLKPREAPPYVGTKHVNVNLAADVPRLIMGYNLPVLKTAEDPMEPYALTVLMMALDGGNSARFSEHLIRGKSLAANITTAYNPFQLFYGQLTIVATPAEDHSLDELKEGFLIEIQRLQNELLTEEELHRIKTNALADHIFKQDSLIHQANELGSMESVLGLKIPLKGIKQ